jgi:hypothetical protein
MSPESSTLHGKRHKGLRTLSYGVSNNQGREEIRKVLLAKKKLIKKKKSSPVGA